MAKYSVLDSCSDGETILVCTHGVGHVESTDRLVSNPYGKLTRRSSCKSLNHVRLDGIMLKLTNVKTMSSSFVRHD